jgi:hypothetical protein
MTDHVRAHPHAKAVHAGTRHIRHRLDVATLHRRAQKMRGHDRPKLDASALHALVRSKRSA